MTFKYVVLVTIPLVLSAILLVIKNNFHSDQIKCSINLFVGILSARNNFDKRQSIRRTWFQTIHNLSHSNFNSQFGLCQVKINPKFIIGDKHCPIHPLFRTNQFCCHFNNINFSPNNTHLYLHHLNQTNTIAIQSVSHKKLFRGFSFLIRHPIIVTKIGVQESFLNNNQDTTVVLLNAQNKEMIASVNISLSSSQRNHIHYEDIQSVALPKDFYGLLLIDNEVLQFNARHQLLQPQNQNGFLQILRAYYGFSDFESIRYSSNLIMGPTLAYSIADPKAIESLIESQNQSQLEWNQEILNINRELSNEIIKHDDILLIDSIDTYRNLPEKVLRFLHYAIKLDKFTHFLKTDDDCYLNINNIIHKLIEINQIKNVWSGKRLWPLDYYGKWAENDYGSPFYPPFACGSGYILSVDLVEWLSSNIDHLHRFQGEDVSMGIWLSAINPYYDDDNRWICNLTEYNILESFSIPQLDAKDLIKIHNFLINA